MTIYTLIVIASWAAFIIVWPIGALSAKRTVTSFWRWFAIRVLLFAIVVLVLHDSLASGGLTRPQLVSAFNAANPGLAGLGAALCALGVAFAIWARVALGRNWGMPRAVKENPELVTTGPYQYVRHPIYTGVILAMIGTSLVTGAVWLGILVFAGAYFIYSALQEEKLMVKTFPDTYPAYMKRSKMLIPFIF